MATKVVALVLGALLGATAIPYLPEANIIGEGHWLDEHFTLTKGLWNRLDPWVPPLFAPQRKEHALRFE